MARSTGTAASANIQSLTEGMHTFGVYVEASNVKSEKAFENLYIGKDTPQAPVNVVLTAAGLTWDAVTAGEHGGYVNAAEIGYEVKLDGESKGSTAPIQCKGLFLKVDNWHGIRLPYRPNMQERCQEKPHPIRFLPAIRLNSL